MTEIFGELDARLSWVHRWVVVNTIKKQSVAEHCFNVERIATRIAEEWLEITDVVRLYNISQLALHHDNDEAITGDLPSPSKWVLSEEWVDEHSGLWYNRDSPEREIVKLADKMEAYWFLSMERKLGNQYIEGYLQEIHRKVLSAATALGVHNYITGWLATVDRMKGTTRGSAV